ncbi:MAG: hypothetical protein WBX14_03780 [Candidatus Udaeobacter sp.]
MPNNNQSLGETTLALYSLGIACLALSAVKALACAVASTTTTQAQIPTSVGEVSTKFLSTNNNYQSTKVITKPSK